MKYYVYVLISLSSDYKYVGMTDNPERRLKQHNTNGTRSTAGKGPYRMLVIRACADRAEAVRAERYYKTGFGRKSLKKMLEKITGSGILPPVAYWESDTPQGT